MNSVKISLFDLFAYTLPGIFILIGIFFLTNSSLQNLADAIIILKNLNLPVGIAAIIMAYVLGFSFDAPGFYYYKMICKVFKDPQKETRVKYNLNSEKEQEIIAMVRDKSPVNNEMLQTWKLLKTMSHNLSFSFLMLTFIVLFKIIFSSVKNLNDWYLLSVSCFILSIVLIHRAIVFDSWFYKHLVHTEIAINIIKLDNKNKRQKKHKN